MKQSKIQLVDLTLVRLSFLNNPHYDNSPNDDKVDGGLILQSAKTIHKFPEYWDDQKVDSVAEAIKDHTYRVKLGVRTIPDDRNAYPYQFEVMYSGVILVLDHLDGDPNVYAAKYGLTLLYGAIRDQVHALSSQMSRGRLLLPTMSFEDERYEDLLAAHEKIAKRVSGRLSGEKKAEQ